MLKPLALTACLALSTLAQAATWQAVWVTWRDDPRLERTRLERAYPGHPAGSVKAALEVAVAESQANLEASGHQLKPRQPRMGRAKPPRLDGRAAKAQSRLCAAGHARGAAKSLDARLGCAQNQAHRLNLSEAADELRGTSCHPQWLHTYPSQRMLADAWAQWLSSRGWREVLWLVGSSPTRCSGARGVGSGLETPRPETQKPKKPLCSRATHDSASAAIPNS